MKSFCLKDPRGDFGDEGENGGDSSSALFACSLVLSGGRTRMLGLRPSRWPLLEEPLRQETLSRELKREAVSSRPLPRRCAFSGRAFWPTPPLVRETTWCLLEAMSVVSLDKSAAGGPRSAGAGGASSAESSCEGRGGSQLQQQDLLLSLSAQYGLSPSLLGELRHKLLGGAQSAHSSLSFSGDKEKRRCSQTAGDGGGAGVSCQPSAIVTASGAEAFDDASASHSQALSDARAVASVVVSAYGRLYARLAGWVGGLWGDPLQQPLQDVAFAVLLALYRKTLSSNPVEGALLLPRGQRDGLSRTAPFANSVSLCLSFFLSFRLSLSCSLALSLRETGPLVVPLMRAAGELLRRFGPQHEARHGELLRRLRELQPTHPQQLSAVPFFNTDEKHPLFLTE